MTANMVEAIEMCPQRAHEEVAELVAKGEVVSLVERQGQCYSRVNGIGAKSPDWDKPKYDILVAIPAAYDAAQLDGFYVEWPCSYKGGEPPRVQGEIIELDGRQWRQVSWHYPDGKPWQRGQDSLESHIVHCRGFFLHRGAINER